MQAINISHPFGLRIWKPALYRKIRSIDTRTDKDLHSTPGARPFLPLFWNPGNLLWLILFGWWLAVLYVFVAVVVLGPVALVGQAFEKISGGARGGVGWRWAREVAKVWDYCKVGYDPTHHDASLPVVWLWHVRTVCRRVACMQHVVDLVPLYIRFCLTFQLMYFGHLANSSLVVGLHLLQPCSNNPFRQHHPYQNQTNAQLCYSSIAGKTTTAIMTRTLHPVPILRRCAVRMWQLESRMGKRKARVPATSNTTRSNGKERRGPMRGPSTPTTCGVSTPSRRRQLPSPLTLKHLSLPTFPHGCPGT